jgi:nucleoside-diphosphate-sugar epimerase
MKLTITGAAGFLGRYSVTAALRRGHEVRALVRPRDGAAGPWPAHDRLSVVEHDLAEPDGLDRCLAGSDAVVHLAAKAGAGESTLRITDHLLDAVARAGLARLVAISSFSVYDYEALGPGQTLDETCPLEPHPERRDDYTRAKLRQERRVRDFAAERGLACAVLRPGAIYGQGRLWTARLGLPVGGRLWLRVGGQARVPLTYVENCAEAVAMAAEADGAAGAVLNVVDDDPPTQAEYASAVRRHMGSPPAQLVLPRGLVRLPGAAARLAGIELPGLLGPGRFDARFKPLGYSNARIRAVLGWSPRYGLDEALARCGRPEAELLAVGSAKSRNAF